MCSLSKVGQDKLLERAHHQGALGKMTMQGQGKAEAREGMIGAREREMHDRSRLSDQ